MKREYFYGLTRTVALIACVSVILPTLVTTYFEQKAISKEIIGQARQNVESLTSIVAGALSEPLWDLSKKTALSQIKSLLKDVYIEKAVIHDADNNIFVSEEKTSNTPTAKRLEFTKPIYYQKTIIGQLTVIYSDIPARAYLRSYRIRSLTSTLEQLVLCILSIFLLMRRHVVSKIEILLAQAKLLSRKALEKPFQWEGEDSLSVLGRNLEAARLELKNALEELERKNQSLNQINEKLEKQVAEKTRTALHASKMAALGDMAGGIAHEINNPLAIIKGKTLQLVRALKTENPPTTDQLTEALEKIDRTVERISGIIRGLRYFSRNGENDPMVSVPVNKLIEDTLDLCREKFKINGVRIITDNLPQQSVECRPVQLAQVLLNLLNNSFDAVSKEQDPWIKIEAKVETHKNSLEISVTDSGKGIPQEIADKIMNPFFTTKPVGQGTGLGLSISKGIIESHLGKLVLNTHSPHTCFVMELPIKQALNLERKAA